MTWNKNNIYLYTQYLIEKTVMFSVKRITRYTVYVDILHRFRILDIHLHVHMYLFILHNIIIIYGAEIPICGVKTRKLTSGSNITKVLNKITIFTEFIVSVSFLCFFLLRAFDLIKTFVFHIADYVHKQLAIIIY